MRKKNLKLPFSQNIAETFGQIFSFVAFHYNDKRNKTKCDLLADFLVNFSYLKRKKRLRYQ